jgi:ribosomal protein S18 acetylase RimI-like enzyme
MSTHNARTPAGNTSIASTQDAIQPDNSYSIFCLPSGMITRELQQRMQPFVDSCFDGANACLDDQDWFVIVQGVYNVNVDDERTAVWCLLNDVQSEDLLAFASFDKHQECIYNVCVAPHKRRCGIGHILMTNVLRILHEQYPSMYAICLCVLNDAPSHVAPMYEKLGFTCIAERRFPSRRVYGYTFNQMPAVTSSSP